jgi:hypothetical protein
MNSKLAPAEKEAAMVDVLFMLQVKFLTSVFAHYFKFPADREIAQLVYESLSRKYALKVYGSWGALLTARSKDIIAKNSIHYQTFLRFDDDSDILYAITDIQGRIKEVVKKMYSVLIELRDNRSRIQTTNSTVTIDGEMILKDRTKGQQAYRRYIHTVVTDRTTFIRSEVLKVTCDAMHTMPEKLLVEILNYCSANYGVKGEEAIGQLLDETVIHAIEYINTNRAAVGGGKDLARLCARLRALYMTSRMVDPALLKMRDLSEEIVLKSTSTKNKAVQSSLRTGLQLYIVLRALTMNYYS